MDAETTLDATYQYIETQPPKPVGRFQELKHDLVAKKDKYSESAMHRDARDDAMERAAGYDPDKTYGKTQLIGFREDDSIQQAILGYHPKNDSTDVVTDLYRVIDNKVYTFTSKDPGADDYAKTSSAIWSAATHFQPLSGRAQPSGPGFCVAGGMFADDGRPPVHESFTLVVHFKNHPDARFTIDAHAIDRVNTDEPSLKHRVDSELGILRANVGGHVDVLVRGEREVAGQQGYQIGLSMPNDTVPNTTAYKFFWSADGVPNDVTRPFMEVDLTIQPDEHKPATITTADEAKVLWENLLQGLRIRPGAARR